MATINLWIWRFFQQRPPIPWKFQYFWQPNGAKVDDILRISSWPTTRPYLEGLSMVQWFPINTCLVHEKVLKAINVSQKVEVISSSNRLPFFFGGPNSLQIDGPGLSWYCSAKTWSFDVFRRRLWSTCPCCTHSSSIVRCLGVELTDIWSLKWLG